MHTIRSAVFGLAAVAMAVVACDGSSTSDSGVPAAPSGLTATELEGGAHLTWKDNSNNEAGFMIERKVGGADYATLTSVPFDTTQYHDANLTSGVTYRYRMMAMGKQAGKDSPYSNEVTFLLGAGSSDAGARD